LKTLKKGIIIGIKMPLKALYFDRFT
jgi:hypothetical protein